MNKAECLLNWHGSKRALAPAIVKLFPKGYERMLYVEPFCGAAAVFWAKRPSHSEVLNDRDGELMNFLWTVKLHPRELVRTLRLLPNSRALFAQAIDCMTLPSSVFRAARFLYLSKTSFGGLREHWAPQGPGRARDRSLPQRGMPPIACKVFRWAKRLADTTLECAPWQEVIEKYDSPRTLFYIDPPYPEMHGYGRPFGWPEWRELRLAVERLKGKFVLSGPGNARMKLLWRGYHERLTTITSSLGPNDRVQRELLVWNY